MSPLVDRFQARQLSISEIEIQVIAPTLSVAAEKQLVSTIESALADSVRVRVERVDAIESAESGKLRYFIPLKRAD